MKLQYVGENPLYQLFYQLWQAIIVNQLNCHELRDLFIETLVCIKKTVKGVCPSASDLSRMS